ncbi:MAG: LacI family DNA-binding transcriptional regulator [Bacteroidetes bacterium]|nr:LacI family DNA-binding transcriptional regulator [Bacteroidota bacterium]
MSRRESTSVTIYDVARRAGVAISTVSRVINDSIDVSDRTRSEVLQAIEHLKFHPSRTARSLAQQEYHSFAVAMPSFTAPFQNELLKGVRAYIREPGLDLLICDLGSKDMVGALKSFLDRGAVRGLLVCGPSGGLELYEELENIQTPIVLVGHAYPTFDSFYWDEVQGVQMAVAHLLSKGHTEICLIRSAVDSETQSQRIEGYKRALAAAAVAFDPEKVVSGKPTYHAGFSEEDGFDAMNIILQNHPKCTAVMASSDVQAIGALAAVKEAGLSVPSDIAIMGNGDIKTSRYIGLSSVHQSVQHMGFSAAKRLHDRILGSHIGPPERLLVEPKLEIRASTL